MASAAWPIMALTPAPWKVISVVMRTGICMCEAKMLFHCGRRSAQGERPVSRMSMSSLRMPASLNAAQLASVASCSGSLTSCLSAYESPMPMMAATRPRERSGVFKR